MTAIAENLADKLAQDVLAEVEASGDETLIEEIARALGTSSPTTEELFRTFVRVRRAETRARALLERKAAARRAATPAPAQPNPDADQPGDPG